MQKFHAKKIPTQAGLIALAIFASTLMRLQLIIVLYIQDLISWVITVTIIKTALTTEYVFHLKQMR